MITSRALHPRISDTELLKIAHDAASAAYSRYSHFSVGAAVLTTKGNVYCGVNVENASYPVGTCAERNAIAAAVLAEGPEVQIKEIGVAAVSRGVDAPCSPCGACRQAIYEMGREAIVVYRSKNLAIKKSPISELLPFAFEEVEEQK